MVADPSISLEDLMQPMENFISLHMKGRRDVAQAVWKQEPTWKTAPNMEWLSDISPLLMGYLMVARNGVLPSKKHKDALMKIEKAEPVNYSKKNLNDFIDKTDEMIKIALSQIRTLKKDEVAKGRAYKKASKEEKYKVDQLLKVIACEPGNEGEEAGGDAQQVAEPGSSRTKVPPIPKSWSQASLAIVPVLKPGGGTTLAAAAAAINRRTRITSMSIMQMCSKGF